MSAITTKRLIKTGVVNFFRNIWVSIAATSMVTITLFIISVMIILYTLATLAIQNSTDKVGVVTAYFNYNSTDKEIQNVIAEIQALPGVKSVDYTSQDQAIEAFKIRHANEPTWLQTLNEFQVSEKPLPASVAVHAENLNDYPSIYHTLTSQRYEPFFQNVRDNQKIIDKLHKIIVFITRFGLLLAGIFMIVTIMVTFNTLRLTIYNRREEVEIMRLVGATNSYIRGPFFIEGIMYAIFATIITSGLIFGMLFVLEGKIQQFLYGATPFANLGNTLIHSLYWQILLINALTSVLLVIIASTIAMRRYLRI